MDYSHQIWTASTFVEDGSIELCTTGASDDMILTCQSYFDKSLKLKLWMGFYHQIWTASTPLKEE